jgi:hypothetical protein
MPAEPAGSHTGTATILFTGLAEAEALGMAREVVRFQRLPARMPT